MEDGRHHSEAGISRTQIEAARQRLSRNENLSELQEENISYFSEMITGSALAFFIVFFVLYIFFGIDTFVVLGILLLLTAILIFQFQWEHVSFTFNISNY